MYKVHYLNKISPKGTELWTEDYQTTDKIDEAEGILVRSASMHDMTMPENLLAIARAGAGVNNIQASSWVEAWNSACLSRCPRGERPLVELSLEPGVFLRTMHGKTAPSC